MLFVHNIGAIEIQATPPDVVTVGEVESVVLECTLQGAETGDGIDYVWTGEGNSLPNNAQTSGSKILFIVHLYNTLLTTISNFTLTMYNTQVF